MSTATATDTPLPGRFFGEAWGNRGNVQSGDIGTRLGRAAYQPCPCRGTGGKILSNNVQHVDAGDAYRAGELVSTAQAQKLSGQLAYAQMTSRVVNVRALGGLITADAIKAVATVNANTATISGSDDGSAFVNLRIGGVAVSAAPGTRMTLTGFGYVVLHAVRHLGNGTTVGGIQVEMMRIVITKANSLNIPVGTVLVVAHAQAGYRRIESRAIVSAAAWGSDATSRAGDIVNRLGRSAAVYLSCRASGTTTGSNQVNSSTVPGILATGSVVSDLSSSVSSDVATARASSRLENVNLLDGVLTADVIRGVTTVTVSSAGGATSFDGSRFVNLHVLGQAIGDNVAPNTQIAIPNLGTLTLYATKSRSDNNEAHGSVFMVILQVTTTNSLNIPVGTTIRLAHASADAAP
jgi:hypothetical protein